MSDPVAIALVLVTLALLWVVVEVRRAIAIVEPIAASTLVRTATSF